jgi:hypothetical protein
VNRKNLPNLRRRILNQHRNMPAHAAEHVTPAAMGPMHPAPPQVMTMPLTVVEVTADYHQVSEALPLYAGHRGAPIPATGPGQWVQVHAAGRA